MSLQWATVTANSPLRVKLDGNDAAALPITPDSLIDPLTLTVGDRVRVELHGDSNRVIVHGRSAGLPRSVQGRKNRLINGNFRTNQRAYASAATISIGSYCFDRWKASGRVNLAYNPSAITNTTGWGGSGATITRLTGLTIPGLAGVTTAARATMAAGGGGTYFRGDSIAPGSAAAATVTYTASFWLRSSVAKTITPNLEFEATLGGGVLLFVAGSPVALAANTWTRVSVSGTAPAGTGFVGLYAYTTTTWAAGDTIDATGTLIETGSVLLPYFDGSYAGCSWAGTASLSSSYSVPGVLPTLTYVSAPQGQTVTLNANSLIQQVIERANVSAGTYTLSWSGTATARVYNRLSAAPPAFAASPLTVTLDGLDDVVVEVTTAAGVTGMLGAVQLEIGSVATPYEYIPVADEVAECQWYYVRYVNPDAGSFVLIGYFTNTTNFYLMLPIKMRAAPVVTAVSNSVASTAGGSALASLIVLSFANGAITLQGATASATGVANGGAYFSRTTIGVLSYVALESEL